MESQQEKQEQMAGEEATTSSCESCETDKEEMSQNSTEASSQESEDFKRKYFYLAAEIDNITKRFQREKETLIKFSNEKLMVDLLEVMDNFDRTLSAISSDEDAKVKNIAVGIKMVKGQFLDVLKKFGLTEVESFGKSFDPHFHEAVAQRTEEGRDDHEILEEYQKGYLLNGRLIRAAKVVVNTIQ